MTNMRGRFFDLVNAEPILPPMGVMELSAPTVNRPMPDTTNKDPTRKDSICPVGRGVTNRHSKHTMQRMGSTEVMLSCTLPAIMAFCLLNSFISMVVYHQQRKKGSMRKMNTFHVAPEGWDMYNREESVFRGAF